MELPEHRTFGEAFIGLVEHPRMMDKRMEDTLVFTEFARDLVFFQHFVEARAVVLQGSSSAHATKQAGMLVLRSLRSMSTYGALCSDASLSQHWL